MRTTLVLGTLLLFCTVFAIANDTELAALEQKAINEQNPSLFNQVAAKFIDQAQLSSAKKNAEKALMLAAESNNVKTIAKSNELLGIISKERFDYSNAIEFLLLSLDGWKKTGNEAGIANINRHIGQIFFYQNDYTNALIHLNRAKERFEKLNSAGQLAIVHQSLGDVYLAQNFFGKAKESFIKAFDLNIETESYTKAAAIARFLGKVTLEVGDYDGALVYFSQSLDLHGSIEDLPNIAQDYNDIALTYLASGDYDEAKENNSIAYDLRTEIRDSIGTAECLKNFGLIYTKLGQSQKAIPFLKKSAEILGQLDIQESVPTMYQEISSAFSTLGDFVNALKYQKAFAKSQQQLFDQDKATAMLELTTRYESESEAEEHKQQIAQLEKDKLVSSRMRLFLLAVIVLIAGLLATLYINYERKKKANVLLKEKNEEITWQKSEIDRKNIQLQEKAASLDLLNNKLVGEMAERESIERSSFARDSFLAMMSHQMRTPINIIVGLSHLLLEENPREDQKESLRNLQFSANNLVVFINDVLDYSKIEAGKLVMQTRDFKLPQIVEDVNKWSQIPAEEKDVQLGFSIDKKVPEILTGDPVRLNQILTNLISNSLSYTDTGNIDTRISLFQLSDRNVTLEIVIEDNGRGIEKAKLEEMFRKFTRDPEADIYDGFNTSGLELAITKRLVDLQNGRIEADSELGKGTVFKVYLPYTIPSNSLQKEPVKQNELLPYHYLVGKKILVVEDNKINQLVVRKMLTKLGVKVTTADNGLEALDRIYETYFDLILMDIQMPKMDGYRATAEIRKSEDPLIANVPIIALTASAYLTEKDKAQLFGMNDHVGKPFGPEELMEKISNCLARKEKGMRIVRGGAN
ncbi:MAG: tetratricopeptide repeat protein [Bacteroidota bacterium]